MKITFLAILALLQNPTSVLVRPGAAGPILLDGACDDEGWRSARRLTLGYKAALYVVADSSFVWLCVDPPPTSYATVDLYLRDGKGGVHNLHASAKLGERTRESAGFPDWIWWNNRGWAANVAQFDGAVLQGEQARATFKPVRGREFQIARHKFSGQRWHFMVDVQGLGQSNSAATFPELAQIAEPETWAVLEL